MNKTKQPVSIEVEANNVKEAIKIALERLHVKKDRVIVTILSEGIKGLFGMAGSKAAKIRVTLKDADSNA